MPQRQHLQRLTRIWAKNPIYFLTVCTAQRRMVLRTQHAANILVSAWHSASDLYGWAVGRYVVMPDHVHFFAQPWSDAKSLSDFMRDWKKWTARRLADAAIASPPIWQAEFFDHVLRSANSYSEKWEYVRENPVRAGLVAEADQWPYQGECESLRL